ncbi:DUF3618 domain-containing protein [Streptomonospora sp. PA3]|uniref:DUF3618 domain-containing protein n=1 Tax=Streptomonospora sp. PA3 TaxID=2607326 RepID=UPI0012DC180B|nr:DUF3618 domain-containing protein [Streptomonospora sp. PA3]MUL43730.1 DUF3618 domain-containing protein [Streptomonospora sp. PA3]
MGETPDQIRQDIERTRTELVHDTDQLAQRADPRRMAKRRTAKMRAKAAGMRECVMGSGSGGGSAQSVRSAGRQATGAAKSASERARQETQGNPLAAGLIAFGAGLLAASAVSESRSEQKAAEQVRQRAGGALEPAKQAVTESAERVKEQATESARSAGEELKESASGSAQRTAQHSREEAQTAAQQVRGS